MGVFLFVFGQTEYCIAWPSPSRYGTQLKYGASNGLLWVFTHNPCMIMSAMWGRSKLTKCKICAFLTLHFCRCAFDFMSCVTNVDVETPNMSTVNFSSSINFGPGTPMSLILMLM